MNLDLNIFLIIIIIAIGYFYYRLNVEKRSAKQIVKIIKKNDLDKKDEKYNSLKLELEDYIKHKLYHKIDKIEKTTEKSDNHDMVNIADRDRQVIYDPITPPERRLPRHIYNKDSIKRYINIPTRGYPDNYQLMGILSRDSDEKTLQLYGRQKYPGASTYEYYVRGRDLSGLETKIPINLNNDKELYSNDELDIPIYNDKKGKFKVTIYELDAPKYNPYVI